MGDVREDKSKALGEGMKQDYEIGPGSVAPNLQRGRRGGKG